MNSFSLKEPLYMGLSLFFIKVDFIRFERLALMPHGFREKVDHLTKPGNQP